MPPTRYDGAGRVSCQRIVPAALAPGDHVRESHHLHLDPVPRLVSEARRFVLEHAPDLSSDTQDSLVLLTSELVTNAVLHARTEIELGITIGDESIVVTVHDLALARPEPAAPAAPRGRPPRRRGERRGGGARPRPGPSRAGPVRLPRGRLGPRPGVGA